jgi:predicted nucleic acid-binding protein
MPTPIERVLLDTNVLVYAMNRDSEHHDSCRNLLERAALFVVALAKYSLSNS